MPKAISNSSPLIHLAKIGRLSLLKDFWNEVIIPEAVYRECILEGGEREEVKALKEAEWLKVVNVKDRRMVKLLSSEIDMGESEVISLAMETEADIVLLDDAEARIKARLFNLRIAGTIGILLRAKREGKIDSLKDELMKLRMGGFWIDDKLQNKILSEVGE